MNALFTVLALLSLVGGVATLVVVVLARRVPAAERARRHVARVALPLAAAVAAVSTAGSLYYSEIAGFTPCRLCWYQRYAMYPLVALLPLAGLLRKAALTRAAVGLATLGGLVSLYHWSIELNPSLQVSGMCTASVPCTAAWVWELGFVSIAFMALSGFLFIIALLVSTRPGRSAAPRRDARALATAAAGVLAVVVAGGVLPNPGQPAQADEPGATQVTAAVEVTGQALPPLPESGADPALGMPVPQLSGSDFDGRPVAVQADDRPKAIVFLAHWCPHCQQEVPVVQEWLDRVGKPTGVDLYSVSTGVDPAAPNYPPDEWLRREGWSLPVLADDEQSSAARAYGLPGYPYWVFVDRDNTVIGRHSGELSTDQLSRVLAKLAD